MSLDINHLKNRASNLGDDELLKIAFTNSHEYHQAAVDAAKAELSKRGYTIEVVVTRPTGSVTAMNVATLTPHPQLNAY
ncbi:MAG: hypothetical protein MOB07_01210 [Acidobacteria bacterium]|nr:hypothetical protein [Acidobacteriota bacterium]